MRRACALCLIVLAITTNASDAVELGDAAAAQQSMLNQESREAQTARDIASMRGRLDDQVIELFYAAYVSVKAAGIKVSDPKGDIDDDNANMRRQGLGEIQYTVASARDNGLFVVVQSPNGRTPHFHMPGYGSISAGAEIRDNNFESTGKFSPPCKFELYVGRDSKLYPCRAFMDAKLDKEVVRDMKSMIASSIQEAAEYKRTHP